jgi:hypothetical protein
MPGFESVDTNDFKNPFLGYGDYSVKIALCHLREVPGGCWTRRRPAVRKDGTPEGTDPGTFFAVVFPFLDLSSQSLVKFDLFNMV